MFRIYRARVASIEVVEGVQQIYVAPFRNYEGDGGNERAFPPNPIPFSEMGSGMVSTPDVGTECLVADLDGEDGVQILSYTPSVYSYGSTPFGQFTPEKIKDGSFMMKVGGNVKTFLSMVRGGIIQLGAGFYGDITINGATKTIKYTSKNQEIHLAGAKIFDKYYRENHLTGVPDVTAHTEYYTKTQETPEISDQFVHGEKAVTTVPPLTYVPAARVKAGTIAFDYDTDESHSQHTYQIEAFNATSTPQFKDTIAGIYLGDQAGTLAHYHKDNSGAVYPPGTLIEIKAKKNNTALESQAMLWRYGKLTGDITGGEGTQAVQGEIFRHQIYDGITPGVGVPVVDPLGEGKGYNYGREDAAQTYVQSFGRLNSDSSIWRMNVSSYSNTPFNSALAQGIKYQEIIGGEDSLHSISLNKVNMPTGNTIEYLDILTEEHKITSLTTTEASSFIMLEPDQYSLSINENGVLVMTEAALDLGFTDGENEGTLDLDVAAFAVVTTTTGSITAGSKSVVIADDIVLTSSEVIAVDPTANMLDVLKEQLDALADTVDGLNSKIGDFITAFNSSWVPAPMDGGASLKVATLASALPLQVATTVVATQISGIKSALSPIKHIV